MVKRSALLWISLLALLALGNSEGAKADAEPACKKHQAVETAWEVDHFKITCIDKCQPGEIYTAVSLDGQTNCTKEKAKTVEENPMYVWLIGIIRFLSAGVGIAVVGGIVWGGIMYAAGRDNPGQTQRATAIIVNALIGLLLYIFMFAILNFLIPGGILR